MQMSDGEPLPELRGQFPSLSLENESEFIDLVTNFTLQAVQKGVYKKYSDALKANINDESDSEEIKGLSGANRAELPIVVCIDTRFDEEAGYYDELTIYKFDPTTWKIIVFSLLGVARYLDGQMLPIRPPYSEEFNAQEIEWLNHHAKVLQSFPDVPS